MRKLLLLLTAAISPALFAQQQPPTTGATITGTVICADTSAPARFAKVMLRPAAIDTAAVESSIQEMQKRMEQMRTQAATSNGGTPPRPIPQISPAQLQQQRTNIGRNLNAQAEMTNTTTADINGHYSLSGIPPGNYYVHAEMPGYVDALDQFTFDQITSGDQDTTKRIAALAPMVSIAGAEQQRADLRLERGAGVTGRVLYDDGSPAAGWPITAIPQRVLTHKSAWGEPDPLDPLLINNNAYSSFPAVAPPHTDDLGNFRISGLAAGDYTLRAFLMAPQPGTKTNMGGGPFVVYNLTVYLGDTLHVGEAETFSIAAGQVRSGTDINIPLRTLHNISGRVVALSDGHGIAGGSVFLSTKDDPTYHPGTQLGITGDGSFQFFSVPSGTYTLTIESAADTKTTVTKTTTSTRTTTKSTHIYGNAETTIILGDADLTGITLQVPEPKNQRPDYILSESISSTTSNLGDGR